MTKIIIYSSAFIVYIIASVLMAIRLEQVMDYDPNSDDKINRDRFIVQVRKNIMASEFWCLGLVMLFQFYHIWKI